MKLLTFTEMPTKRFLNAQKMSPIGTKYRKQLRKNPTRSETEFREILKKHEIHHQFQRLVYTPTRFFILDFVIKMKPFIIFEIDGNSHIGREAYDERRTVLVINQRNYRKYSFIRLTNEQVFNGEALEVLRNLYPRRFRSG
jgi:very-short-patch-repair endonuclease